MVSFAHYMQMRISEISERIVIREIDSGGLATLGLYWFQRVVKRDESYSCGVDEGPRFESECLFLTAINRINSFRLIPWTAIN